MTGAMEQLSKILVMAGLGIAAAGVLLYAVGRIPGFGKLPGDIFIQKGNFSFYFPLATCVVVSLILTLVFNLSKRH